MSEHLGKRIDVMVGPTACSHCLSFMCNGDCLANQLLRKQFVLLKETTMSEHLGKRVDVTVDDSTVTRIFVPPVDTGGKYPELDAIGDSVRRDTERLELLRKELIYVQIICCTFIALAVAGVAYSLWRIIL